MSGSSAAADQRRTGDGIVLLEHVNLTVPKDDKEGITEAFYLQGLGNVRDPRVDWMLHANIGLSQFHLLPSTSKPQIVPGYFVLFFTDFAPLLDRLKAIKPKLCHTTAFNYEYHEESASGRRIWDKTYCFSNLSHCVEITCPYGNQFKCFLTPTEQYAPPSGSHPPSSRKEREAVSPLPSLGDGLAALVYFVRPKTLESVVGFYTTYLNVQHCTLDQEDRRAFIPCGPVQYLVFQEHPEDETSRAYDGHHICLYITDFQCAYDRFQSDGLTWNNPKFSDRCDTWEETKAEQQFRFLTIIDPDSKQSVLTLEHEIRSTDHPKCPLDRE